MSHLNSDEESQGKKALLQQQVRDNAIAAGTTPDTLFALDNDSNLLVFNVQAFLQVLEFQEPIHFAKVLDRLIFSHLGLICQDSMSSELDLDTYNAIYLLKRLRDALLHGVQGSSSLKAGYSPYLMVLYIHRFSTLHDCLQSEWELGITPQKAFSDDEVCINEFKEIRLKKFRSCKTLADKVRWFIYQNPRAKRIITKSNRSRWHPYLGGFLVNINSKTTSYKTKKKAIAAAESFQSECVGLVEDPDGLKMLLVAEQVFKF
jgi:hypothetical protein